MNREQLTELNKQELIEIILRQHQQIEDLMDAYKKLKADHEALLMKFEHSKPVALDLLSPLQADGALRKSKNVSHLRALNRRSKLHGIQLHE